MLTNNTPLYKEFVKKLIVNSNLVYDICDKQLETESHWRHYDSSGNILTSPTGSKGISQLNSKFYGPEYWTDPFIALTKYVEIMNGYLSRFGTYRKALAAYNWGPANVSGYTKDGMVHPAWDGTREWRCPVGLSSCATGQRDHYLDLILGPEWKEPTAVTYSVGSGVMAAMTARGDTPATNELYIHPDVSFTWGTSGTRYDYVKALNRTFIYEPINIITNNVPSLTIVKNPIKYNYSTPQEWGFRLIRSVVIHDLEGSADAAINWWNNPSAGASAHYIIRKDGTIVETVAPENIAWHAGTDRSTGRTEFWKNTNINGYSIGIELEGFTTDKWTDAQYTSLTKLGQLFKDNYKILPEHTFDKIDGWHTHAEISNQRSDPGPNFDMQRVLQGIK